MRHWPYPLPLLAALCLWVMISVEYLSGLSLTPMEAWALFAPMIFSSSPSFFLTFFLTLNMCRMDWEVSGLALSILWAFAALCYFHKVDFMSWRLAFLFSDLLFSILHCSINLIADDPSQTFVPNSARLRGSFQTKSYPGTFLNKQNISPYPILPHCLFRGVLGNW